MADFKLNAELRNDLGKGASRRLRREANLVPGIIYGGKSEPQSISMKHNEVIKHLDNEAFYSQIIQLNVAGQEEDVILKDLQRHPAKELIMHADFLRIVKGQKFQTRVPLHFINEATSKGVKMQGGVISHLATDVEITCLPKDLPEFIEVDLSDVELGDIVHISDLKLPNGVESVELSHGASHDLPLVSIHKAKGSAEDDEADAPEAGEGEGEGEGEAEGE